MPRKKRTSFFEDLIEVASKLPGKVGLGLAVVAYLGFHFLATLSQAPNSVIDHGY